MRVGHVRRIGRALGASVNVEVRWHGVDLPRLLDERHAAMARLFSDQLGSLGWEVRPEHTFNIRGERGAVDLIAWRPDCRALLVVELKTLLPDLQGMLSTLDRKRRLAPPAAAGLGWRPLFVGCVLVLPEETQTRNAVERYRPLLDRALPARTRAVRQRLGEPKGDVRGILFLPISRGAGAKRSGGGQIRVRRRGSGETHAQESGGSAQNSAAGPAKTPPSHLAPAGREVERLERR